MRGKIKKAFHLCIETKGIYFRGTTLIHPSGCTLRIRAASRCFISSCCNGQFPSAPTNNFRRLLQGEFKFASSLFHTNQQLSEVKAQILLFLFNVFSYEVNSIITPISKKCKRFSKKTFFMKKTKKMIFKRPICLFIFSI